MSPGGFRSIELNLRGWTALLAVGLSVGTIVVLLTPLAAPIALPLGVIAAWAFLLALDYRRERNLTVALCSDDLDEDLAAEIVSSLEQRGVPAGYQEIAIDDVDGGGVQRGITCRQADRGIAREVMERALGSRR